MSQVGFEINRLQIHQFLGVVPASDGRSAMPLRPDWESGEQAASRRATASLASVAGNVVHDLHYG